MEAVVSDIIRSRMQEPGGLSMTAVVSVAAHVAAVAAIAFLPGILPKHDIPPPVIMNISLGGGTGPENGGITTIGGRNIEASLPAEAPKVEKVAMPTPAEPPKMVMPVEKPQAKLKNTPPPKPVAKVDPLASVRGRGFETQRGSTNVETGARGVGTGLSTTGGAGLGTTLDVRNFCCPEYLEEMVRRIRENWNQRQQSEGAVVMKYTITRSGQLTDIQIEQPSGVFVLDQAAQRALVLTNKIAPLPSAFPEDHLTVHSRFEYKLR